MLAETMRSATRALTKERDDRQSTECRQREDDRLKTCGADSWLECPMRKNKFVHFSVSGVFVALAMAAFIVGCSSGSSGATTDGAYPEPGDCSNGRYVIVDPGTGSASGSCPGSACDGSGLVKDTSTGLTWARYTYYPGYPPGQTQTQAAAYCAGRGGRLPTKDEALAIAGNNYCQSAWPAV